MYHGEVTIEQEGLKDFMDIGKDLGIKGLIHEEVTNLRKLKISEDETFGNVIGLNSSHSPVSLQSTLKLRIDMISYTMKLLGLRLMIKQLAYQFQMLNLVI